VLMAHPVISPHSVPVVKILLLEWTDPNVAKAAYDLMTVVKQTVVAVYKEILGFILNCLQGA
jgi:3-hydroxyacyl-CoA dehydrogenase